MRIYSFMKEIKLYIRASYIVFFFVKTENNNFIKEIKHVTFTTAKFERILEQVKTLDFVSGFH